MRGGRRLPRAHRPVDLALPLGRVHNLGIGLSGRHRGDSALDPRCRSITPAATFFPGIAEYLTINPGLAAGLGPACDVKALKLPVFEVERLSVAVWNLTVTTKNTVKNFNMY
jgi:hypothetical protein